VSVRRRVLVEACVDAIDAALEAEWGGADRLELCGELLQGGVTPSHGLIEAVWDQISIPLFVLIRPRTGDFLYTSDELDVMERDIRVARSLHVDGIVAGALTTDGEVDVAAMRCILDAARPMEVTFHRAFDVCRDRDTALASLAALGVRRVLTSGGAATAVEGAAEIRRLAAAAAAAGGRLTLLAGGGINESNARELVAASGVNEIHVRCAGEVAGAGRSSPAIRFRRLVEMPETSRLVTVAARVREVRRQV